MINIPIENPHIESFHSALKKYKIYQKHYQRITHGRSVLLNSIINIIKENHIHQLVKYQQQFTIKIS